MSEERMTIATVDVCPCGLVMHQGDEDDYDTGGAESGICCPDCGNEKFMTVQQLQAELHTTAKQIGWLKGDKARLSKSIQVRDNAITALIEVHEAELATAKAENEHLCNTMADMRAGTPKGTCTWRFREPFDGDEAWDAECGATWTFIEGGLKDNGAVFCLKCGRLIKEVRPDKESDK